MKKESFLKGALISTMCIVFSKILGIIYVIPFHNRIGEKGGALYSYAYTIYNLFLTLSTVRLPLAISKTGIFDKNDPDYGVYEFKKGFNGQVEEYIGDFELPISSYYSVNKFIKKIKKVYQ